MQNTPDLSEIVSLIMQNPALIEQIAALAKPKAEPEAQPEVKEEVVAQEVIKEENTPVATNMRSHRHELLNAMKPYLSENRRTAIDSMSSILDIIDVVIRKQAVR